MTKKIDYKVYILLTVYGLITISILSIIICIILYYCNGIVYFTTELNTQELSRFGDFIGGLSGTLITIAATLLIWLTYKSQTVELRSTQKLLQDQLKQNKIQQFENTFFKLLQIHNLNVKNQKTITAIKDVNNENRKLRIEITGQNVFKKLYARHSKKYISQVTSLEVQFAKNDTEIHEIHRRQLDNYYPMFYNEHQGNLEHYFQTISKILLYLDNADKLDHNEKIMYAHYLKSQLSYYEKLLIYYHTICNYANEGYEIIEKYEILKGLNKRELVDIYHSKFGNKYL